MKTLAIVLARAGSKGLPGKNIRPIGGKPCVAWTIETALNSSRIARVVVTTDCPHVRAIAASFGAFAVGRPSSLASDTATVDDAARHALVATETHNACDFDAIALLYGNVPVRPADLINNAVALLDRTNCDSVQSYTGVGKHHPWWTCRVDETTGDVTPWEGDRLNHGVYRRQDLPAAHIPDGGVLIVTRAALMLELSDVHSGPHAFLGNNQRGILTAEGSVIDIDTELDALVADAILSQRTEALTGSSS